MFMLTIYKLHKFGTDHNTTASKTQKKYTENKFGVETIFTQKYNEHCIKHEALK